MYEMKHKSLASKHSKPDPTRTAPESGIPFFILDLPFKCEEIGKSLV